MASTARLTVWTLCVLSCRAHNDNRGAANDEEERTEPRIAFFGPQQHLDYRLNLDCTRSLFDFLLKINYWLRLWREVGKSY